MHPGLQMQDVFVTMDGSTAASKINSVFLQPQVLNMLSIAMGLHFCAAVFMLLHLWRWALQAAATCMGTLSCRRIQ